MTQQHDAKALLEGTTLDANSFSATSILLADPKTQAAVVAACPWPLDSDYGNRFVKGWTSAARHYLARLTPYAEQVITLTTRAETAEAEVERLAKSIIDYDTMLRGIPTERDYLLCGEKPKIDAAYDGIVAHARALLKEQGE